MSTATSCFTRTFPAPPQVEHSPPRGTVVPAPSQVSQVLDIWNPFETTKVRAPVPPQVEHFFRFIPSLKPDPEQDLQSATGVIVTFFFAPLQASRKLTDTVTSMSLPRMGCWDRVLPPPANDPNSCSKRSPPGCPPPLNEPPNPGNPPARPNPPNPPAPANALGSKLGF